MNITSVRRIIFCALLCVAVASFSAQLTLAQGSAQSPGGLSREDQTNLDLELYMIAATNQAKGRQDSRFARSTGKAVTRDTAF